MSPSASPNNATSPAPILAITCIIHPLLLHHPGLDPGSRFLQSQEQEAGCRIKSGMTREMCMKALLSRTPGGPETLELADVADPIAGKGELLVRIQYCAINYPDVLV